MEGYVCDRCAAAVPPTERTGLMLDLNGPDELRIMTVSPKGTSVLGIDLCPRCAQAVARNIRERIIISDTREGAWYDSEAEEAPAGDQEDA